MRGRYCGLLQHPARKQRTQVRGLCQIDHSLLIAFRKPTEQIPALTEMGYRA